MRGVRSGFKEARCSKVQWRGYSVLSPRCSPSQPPSQSQVPAVQKGTDAERWKPECKGDRSGTNAGGVVPRLKKDQSVVSMGPGAIWDLFLCLPVATFVSDLLRKPPSFQPRAGFLSTSLFSGSQLLAVSCASAGHGGGYPSMECLLH